LFHFFAPRLDSHAKAGIGILKMAFCRGVINGICGKFPAGESSSFPRRPSARSSPGVGAAEIQGFNDWMPSTNTPLPGAVADTCPEPRPG
ncbi:MAG: hypothetical protein JW929_05680, partial [Anaerolineales bacterium]|nr:hypothetical protein [Anaerolineales bacterium]